MYFSKSLIVFLLFFFTFQGFAQDSTKYIADGTQGEVMKAAEPDTLNFRERFDGWNEFDGSLTTLKLGLGFLYEYANYIQNDAAATQMDSADLELIPAGKIRDVRFLMSGQFKFKRSIVWKIGVMYDGPTDTWFVRETGLMVHVPELFGYFFIGRTKEGFSLNKVMNGYSGWTMERQMAIDVIPILADGIKWMGFLPKSRIIWNAGYYNDVFSEGQSFSTYKWQVAGRVGWLPVYSDDGKTLVHIGINARYGEVYNDIMRLKSRPEAFPAPYFLDTKDFAADQSIHVGYEAYYRNGSFMLGSEFYLHKFHSPETNNPLFHGGEIVATYILTGEVRPYTTVSGIFGFVPVARPITKGGPGAVEAVLRFSTLDLNSGNLEGGSFWRITPMINWYPTSKVRLELAYGYGVLDRFELEGATQFFQGRVQVVF
ncbi:MAG: porin [Bacteroidetes bacterium]|nr:porin [Bacteroidota bacterium]MBP7399411.1 porin [Chitinophagales bacterium]MBP9119443.1 hypothetical protein [Ignavibacterium sp.]MBK7109620.1 porin [Bacteroidota bacterium]MBK8487648.1 porin [Bacteroidota bacterium]